MEELLCGSMSTHVVTQEDIEKFKENGYIIYENFINRDLVERALSRVKPIFNGEFETGVLPDKTKWQKDGSGVDDCSSGSMCNIWKSDRTVAQITLSEKVGKYAAELMNWPGSRANQDNIFFVPPNSGTTTFHQDEPYQDWHEPGRLITCWIALADVSAKGAALEYVRGSHKWPLGSRVTEFHSAKNYRSDLDREAAELGNEVDIVPVVVLSGGAVFHDGKIWHGSNFNKTDKARYSVSTHCMSSDSHFHPTIPSPMFNHYKRFDDLTMDESFFPVLWTRDNKRSKFLESYLHIPNGA